MMDGKIKVVIVDDEPYSRDELKFLLEGYPETEIIGEGDSGEMGLELVITTNPDVVFVDIEMPQMSGMELAEKIKMLKKVPLLIFATAYPDYAAKAFRVKALDYLLKPFDEEQLEETMKRIKEHIYVGKKIEKRVLPIARLAVQEEGRIVQTSY